MFCGSVLSFSGLYSIVASHFTFRYVVELGSDQSFADRGYPVGVDRAEQMVILMLHYPAQKSAEFLLVFDKVLVEPVQAHMLCAADIL